MTPAEHKEFVQAAWRAATPTLLAEYIEALQGEGATIDDMRKAVELMTRVTGAEVEKKQDANAGLATFNIVFQGGSMQAVQVIEAQAAEVVELEAPAAPAEPLELPAPSEAATPSAIEAAPSDFTLDLDSLLGVSDD